MLYWHTIPIKIWKWQAIESPPTHAPVLHKYMMDLCVALKLYEMKTGEDSKKIIYMYVVYVSDC